MDILNWLKQGQVQNVKSEILPVSTVDYNSIAKIDDAKKPESLSEKKKNGICTRIKKNQKEHARLKTEDGSDETSFDGAKQEPYESWQEIAKKEGRDFIDRERIKRKISRWIKNFKGMSDLKQKVFLVSMQEQVFFNNT